MPRKAEDMIDSVTNVASRADGMLNSLEAKGEEVADERIDDSTAMGRAAQVQTIISVIAIGIVAIIGILIYSQVQSSLGTPQNSDLKNASDSTTQGFGSAMELVPTVMIVLVAALVIGVVQRLRG